MSANPDKATVAPATLTFTASNYSNPQTVTVTGVAVGAATINHSFRLAGPSADAIPQGDTVKVAVGTLLAGVTLSRKTLAVAAAPGAVNSAVYTVRLNTAPTAQVVVTPSESSAALSLSPTALTFTTANYNDEQIVTVTGADDANTESETVTISHSTASTDTNYGSTLNIASVTVTTTDDDTALPRPNTGSTTTPTVAPAAPPSGPTGVAATPGDRQVNLSWNNPNNATISKWQFQQKEGDGSYGVWMDIPNSNAGTSSYTVTGLTNGVAYSFRIRAVNVAGNGVPSEEATATPFSQKDVDQAGKARTQALAATSRAWLGMATNVLGARTAPDSPMAVGRVDHSLGEQAMSIVEDMLGINGSQLPTNLTLEEVEDRLWSQSFHLTPAAEANPPEEGDRRPRSWALWGAGELRSYRGNDDAENLSSSGNVKTAWLGVDHQFTNRWLAGVALSFGSTESDYAYRKTDGSTDGGKTSTQLTTFYPYGAVQLSEQFRLWGMAGVGFGSQQHQHSQGEQRKAEGDLRLRLGVIGFEQALSSIGDLNLSLAGDVGFARATTEWEDGSGLEDLSVSLHRLRLGVDSSLALTAHTTGYVNVKGRLDGGDVEMGGAELLAGLRYSQERFSGFLQGRQVYAFDGSYAESGLIAQLRFTSRADGTGLGWTLQPSYGTGDGDVALAAGPSLWSDQQLESLTGSGSAQQRVEMEWSSRMGYGIRLQHRDLLLTPFTEVSLRQGNRHRIGLGLTMEGTSWDVEFSGSSEDSGSTAPTGKVQLSFSKRL